MIDVDFIFKLLVSFFKNFESTMLEGFFSKSDEKRRAEAQKEECWTYYFSLFLYCEGVSAVYFLKIELNEDFDLKPASREIASKV